MINSSRNVNTKFSSVNGLLLPKVLKSVSAAVSRISLSELLKAKGLLTDSHLKVSKDF